MLIRSLRIYISYNIIVMYDVRVYVYNILFLWKEKFPSVFPTRVCTHRNIFGIHPHNNKQSYTNAMYIALLFFIRISNLPVLTSNRHNNIIYNILYSHPRHLHFLHTSTQRRSDTIRVIFGRAYIIIILLLDVCVI